MSLDISKHRNILLQILKDIYNDATLGSILGFKGGTAVYLFYELGRFSVDLDFDLLDESKEGYVFEKIEAIIKEYGKIKEKKDKRHTIFFLLSYDDISQNIKVEINRRKFGSKYEIKNYLGISMKVMVREDMFAHKLCAMMERIGKTNRDIYDVWFFLKNNWPVNREIVEKRTGLPFREFLEKCVMALEKVNERHILSGMGELLDQKQKIWAKAHLKKDVIFLLRVFMEHSP